MASEGTPEQVVIDPEVVRDLTYDEADALVVEVNRLGTEFIAAVGRLYRGRAWIALGFDDWAEMCASRFSGRFPVPREDRPLVIGSLSQMGLSARAIGRAVGVSEPTVRRDLAQVRHNDAPDRTIDIHGSPAPTTLNQALRVVGTDGKQYPSRRPSQPSAPKPRPQRSAEAQPEVQRRSGRTEWTRMVERVSAHCPMDDLTVEDVKELYGAATFLRDYCRGELVRRNAARP